MIQDEHLILQLRRQDSRWTIIELSNGNKIRVFNIAWGYDLGAKFAHITSNISPEQKGSDIDFFHSNEVIQIADEDTDRIIWQRE